MTGKIPIITNNYQIPIKSQIPMSNYPIYLKNWSLEIGHSLVLLVFIGYWKLTFLDFDII
jgi:hypothetical protein